MADQAKSKIDEATEKASADAAAKTQPAPKAETKAAKPAVKKAAKKTVAKKPVAKKAKLKTATSKKAVAKKTTKKVAAKKAAPKKTAAPKAAPKSKTPTITDLKDKIMAKTTTDFTKTVKEAAADVQARLKTAYDKGSEFVSEATEFNKANLEALVESGKILAGAAQEMGRDAVEETKSVFETVTADAKKMAAVKSPTELFQLQGEIARRNFDAVVAYNSKNTEKLIKLANDAFAPISSRMSVAAEKISKAA